jgi:predicted methyltransferase
MTLKFDISDNVLSDPDISKSVKVNYDMMLYIIKKGRPISVSEVAKKRKMNQPTVLNIYKKMKDQGLIEIFERQTRNRHDYGPTWKGIVEFCNINTSMILELDQIIDSWFQQPQFIKTLKNDFGDVVTTDPDYTKKLLKKFIEHVCAVIGHGNAAIDDPERWWVYRNLIGEMELLRTQPERMENVIEFTKHIQFYKKNVQSTMESMQQFHTSLIFSNAD